MVPYLDPLYDRDLDLMHCVSGGPGLEETGREYHGESQQDRAPQERTQEAQTSGE